MRRREERRNVRKGSERRERREKVHVCKGRQTAGGEDILCPGNGERVLGEEEKEKER